MFWDTIAYYLCLSSPLVKQVTPVQSSQIITKESVQYYQLIYI